MDSGPPDSKRPRLGSGAGSWSNSQRALPPPPPALSSPYTQNQPQPFSRPESQPRMLQPIEHHRHPEAEYASPVQDVHRSASMSQAYAPYANPRDSMIKRDSSDDAPQPTYLNQNHVSGPGQENHINHQAHPEDMRRQTMTPYDAPNGPPGPVQIQYRTPSTAFPPPPSPVTHGQPPYGHQGYPAPPPVPPHDSYGSSIGYAGSAMNGGKRKAQRASQACDSCRSLKAKCDEQRPCCNCVEKAQTCNYRDPPPKQGDKAQAEIMAGLKQVVDELKTMREVQAQQARDMTEIKLNLGEGRHLRNVVFKTVSDSERLYLEGIAEDDNEPLPPQPMPNHNVKIEPSSTFDQTVSYRREQSIPIQQPESESDDDFDEPGPLGGSSIPSDHTTGAVRLLLVPAIANMLGDFFKTQRIKNEKYPMVREEQRGLICLYGRGEGAGMHGAHGGELTDDDVESPDGSNSEASALQGPDCSWGSTGGLPRPGIEIRETQGGRYYIHDALDLRPGKVWPLVDSYLAHINIMHPLLLPDKLRATVSRFLRTVPEVGGKAKQPKALFLSGHTDGNVASIESPGTKRKRSPGAFDDREGNFSYPSPPGKPSRSITTALVLLVLALGEICEWKEHRIPDVIHDIPVTSNGSPYMRSVPPGSPMHNSPTAISPHSLGRPSPQDAERSLSGRRRSTDGQPSGRAQPGLRNMDVIPGLAYFAAATDIIGNQLGGNTLNHVHANTLAGLYHGQLGRVLESHAYIHEAGRALQYIMRPRFERYRKLAADSTVPPAKDNPILFAYWTLLQLESDIKAELQCPDSNILAYEGHMPYPNKQAAVESGLTEKVCESYIHQLVYRQHLNTLHKTFYSPSQATQSEESFLETVKLMENALDSFHANLPACLKWNEHDPPADNDILDARLRAKQYGAQVITYRPFVLKILEFHNGGHANGVSPIKLPAGLRNAPTTALANAFYNPSENDPRSAQYLEYAQKGIRALINSTRAFWGMKGRLIVTNVWGTVTAQWGNCLVLQAAYANPILRPYIDPGELRVLVQKTINFLEHVAKPSSALWIHLKILRHVASVTGLIPQRSDSNAYYTQASQ